MKTIKLSLVGSKSKKKDLYQAEFIEIVDSKSKQSYRCVETIEAPPIAVYLHFSSVDYTKDDILNVDKNRLELVKSIRPLSDVTALEQNQPQGANPKSAVRLANPLASSDRKLADDTLSDNDQTSSAVASQNLSKDIPSLSERLNSSSSRQIRPGDRVKSGSKRQLNDPRSAENSKDHRDPMKQIPPIGQKRNSQSKLDRRPSVDKTMDSAESRSTRMPRTSSTRSLKQSGSANLDPMHRSTSSKLSSNVQQHLDELQSEITGHTRELTTIKPTALLKKKNPMADRVDSTSSAQTAVIDEERAIQQRCETDCLSAMFAVLSATILVPLRWT